MQAEASSSSAGPSPYTKTYRPYFTPTEVSTLSARQRGKLSTTRDERGRQVACGFVESVAVRIGFPRRVIATAQMLYHRFHLFFPLKDFIYTEVCLSCLYVSAKLHDTLKKPRDILLASYAVRFPDLLKGKNQVDPGSVDPKMMEHDRRRVLSIERLVLETICFNFRVGERGAFQDLVLIAKTLRVSKAYTQIAWRVAADVHRTLSPLQYPSQDLAIASIYSLSLLLLTPANELLLKEKSSQVTDSTELGLLREAMDVRSCFAAGGDWEDSFASSANQVDSIAHDLLDMYITTLTYPSAVDPAISRLTSPSSPADPSSLPTLTSSTSSPQSQQGFHTAYQLLPFWTPQTLTQLKIQLRQSRPGVAVKPSSTTSTTPSLGISELDAQRGKAIAAGRNEAEVWGAVAQGIGRNDGTVRFLFAS